MFANRIMVVFVAIALALLYYTWEVDQSYSLWIVLPVTISAAIYVLAPQINYWWYQRFPPPLDPMVKTLLGKYLKFYDNLSLEEKKKFDHRLALYQLQVEFMPQGMETVPKDVMGLIAACPIWLTFNKESFEFPKFENIVVYNHAFPSPQHPESLHSSEIYEEDGVIIFSLEHFMPGFLETEKYYHIGMHEYAKVFAKSYPNENYPSFGNDFWKKIEKINGLKREALEGFMGLSDIEQLPVGIVHYFVFSEKFAIIFPKEAAMLKGVFG